MLMIYSFNEWAEARQIDEVSRPSEERNDPFLKTEVKEKDVLYFGIHDLFRAIQEKGHIPNLSFKDIEPKCGKVMDANTNGFDRSQWTLDVAAHNDPFHLGYVKIHDRVSRVRRKAEGSAQVFKIPYNLISAHNFNDLVTDGSLDGHNLWLVIDANKNQAKLAQIIDQKLLERKNMFSDKTSPKAPDITSKQVLQAKNDFGVGNSPTNARATMPNARNALGFRSTGLNRYKGIVPFRPDDPLLALDVAHFNPWKYHNDNKEYGYFED